VTECRSYVIGGNSDRENFQEPGSISRYITEQTCESCNTYNMLKLTRRLYELEPAGAYFDYYERAQLNHIMAHQRPDDGMFAYMVPLMSGAAREFSEPFESFWCCVGTGMESHSKHGDSMYWQDAGNLYVNLFVPSRLDWRERGARIALETRYPYGELITLNIEAIGRPQQFAIALRVPAWCEDPSLRVYGRDMQAATDEAGTSRFDGAGKPAIASSFACHCACAWSRRRTMPRPWHFSLARWFLQRTSVPPTLPITVRHPPWSGTICLPRSGQSTGRARNSRSPASAGPRICAWRRFFACMTAVPRSISRGTRLRNGRRRSWRARRNFGIRPSWMPVPSTSSGSGMRKTKNDID